MRYPSQILSFKGKIMLMAIAVATMAILISSPSILVNDYSRARHEVYEHAETILRLVSAQVKAAVQSGDTEAAIDQLQSLMGKSNVLGIWITLSDGHPFASVINQDADYHVAHPPEVESRICESGCLSVRRRIALDDVILGDILMHYDLRPLHASLRKEILTAILVMIAAILLAILLSMRLQNYLSRPLLHLAETALRVSEQKDYTLRATKFSDDELGDLTDRFNEMLENIGSRDRALRAAHDELENRVEQRTQALSLAKEEAETAMLALRDKSSVVDLLREVAVASNEAPDSDHALQAVIEKICTYAGWPIGHAYILSEENDAIFKPAGIWHLDDPVRFREFKLITNQMSFALEKDCPGGLPGLGDRSGYGTSRLICSSSGRM